MRKLVLLFCSIGCCISAGAQSVNFTSSDLPIVIIDTHGQDILDDPKITADMKIIDNGPGVRNNITDPPTAYSGDIGIETRGNSSQMFPMKSYGLELRDSEGESVDKSLFGLPEESDWVMYAPYTDKTFMRNVLAYTLSNEIGHWAAHCKYVEVVLNGDYRGIYVFMEQIKRNKGRVDISKLKDSDNEGDDVTGGYIVRIDKGAQGWYSPYSSNVQFDYYYPKLKDITDPQKEYIENYVDSFENALNSVEFQDTAKGFRHFADESSFIDYFIVNEVSRNVDAYRLSSYFYKDKITHGGKLIAGPVWDYDLAFRNANYCSGSDTTGWAYQFNSVCSTDQYQVPFWWDRFFEDSLFEGNLLCRWKELRQSVLSEGHIDSLIDSVTVVVNEAKERHFQRWPVLGQYVWPNPDPIPQTYEEEITALKDWISQRLDWIDHNLPDTGPCSSAAVTPPAIPDELSIQVYPNPVQSSGVILIRSPKEQVLTLSVYNADGRKIMTTKEELQAGRNQFSLDLQHQPPGMYFLRFTGPDGIKILKKVLHQ